MTTFPTTTGDLDHAGITDWLQRTCQANPAAFAIMTEDSTPPAATPPAEAGRRTTRRRPAAEHQPVAQEA